jgi:hypothetical protein
MGEPTAWHRLSRGRLDHQGGRRLTRPHRGEHPPSSPGFPTAARRTRAHDGCDIDRLARDTLTRRLSGYITSARKARLRLTRTFLGATVLPVAKRVTDGGRGLCGRWQKGFHWVRGLCGAGVTNAVASASERPRRQSRTKGRRGGAGADQGVLPDHVLGRGVAQPPGRRVHSRPRRDPQAQLLDDRDRARGTRLQPGHAVADRGATRLLRHRPRLDASRGRASQGLGQPARTQFRGARACAHDHGAMRTLGRARRLSWPR